MPRGGEPVFADPSPQLRRRGKLSAGNSFRHSDFGLFSDFGNASFGFPAHFSYQRGKIIPAGWPVSRPRNRPCAANHALRSATRIVTRRFREPPRRRTLKYVLMRTAEN